MQIWTFLFNILVAAIAWPTRKLFQTVEIASFSGRLTLGEWQRLANTITISKCPT